MRERQGLDDGINSIKQLSQALNDNVGLIELGEEEGDADVVSDAETAIRSLSGEIKARQIETLLSGEADANDTYLEVHAGAGGTADFPSLIFNSLMSNGIQLKPRWRELLETLTAPPAPAKRYAQVALEKELKSRLE